MAEGGDSLKCGGSPFMGVDLLRHASPINLPLTQAEKMPPVIL